MVRRVAIVFGILAAAILLMRIRPAHAQPAVKWEIGYWFWGGGATAFLPEKLPLDELYVQVGSFNRRPPYNQNLPWMVEGFMPNRVPAAPSYWIVFRGEGQLIPDLASAAKAAKLVADLCEVARQQHMKVVGVQLDIDSPTGQLATYADFLREVRKGLPKDTKLSITALLDWFRAGTAIDRVIEQVDEFVPQFYDLEQGRERAIAAKIDAGVWGPRFSRFGKRYKIGVSSFGRGLEILDDGTSSPFLSFDDLSPKDLGSNPAFTMTESKDAGGERVLSYRATRDAKIGWHTFKPGQTIQFIVPTAETIRDSVASAKAMKGCAGVIFFRWPGDRDSLVMRPDEVLMAAGAMAQAEVKPEIETVDRHCAAVTCVDVYLKNAKAAASGAVRYRIRSSTELDYFLPDQGLALAVKLAGPSTLEFTVAPYTGSLRMSLGRAVMKKPGEFQVEEIR